MNNSAFKEVLFPIWLTISESAKIGGVNNKTIRRAILGKTIKYKVVKNRYSVELGSLLNYLKTNKKLENKLNFNGIGQYIDKWRIEDN
jgi:hypothetical protein